MTRHSHVDEDDVRVRPGRSKSRPRTKDRPVFHDARDATVLAVDRGRFTITDESGNEFYAVKARELGRKGIVVGDYVEVTGMDVLSSIDRTGREDFARIIRRSSRKTTLRRTADDVDPVERVIVANADQLAIVVAAADPEPRTGLIDRALVAAFDAGIAPILIVTKVDLASADALTDLYSPLDVPIFPVANKVVSPEILAALHGHRTVLIGHSGVGKSTLVNTLVPEADRATGHVNLVTGKGRHTSTSVIALRLPGGGLIIDTPGIRSFGLAHVDPARLIETFVDVSQAAQACPRGCSHDEQHCLLDADSKVSPQRVASVRRLLRSRTQEV